MKMSVFNTIEEAIEDIQNGKMIIVIDNEDRENEGDLLMAAEKVTPEAINFMANYGRGLICMPCDASILKNLNIGPMVQNNTDDFHTAFSVSIDAAATTTGISAHERAMTIKEVLNPDSVPEDFKRPGHIFPLFAKENGVLARAGHTEAAVDFAHLAGLKPAGVICEIMNSDGTMARTEQLFKNATEHGLKIVTIADLIKYRKLHGDIMKREVETKMPTIYGVFKAYGYVNSLNGEHHVALVKGDISTKDPVLVRIHSECLTGDVFGSKRCDCGEQYSEAMNRIEKEGRGVLVYLRQEGRGIGLINKLKAYQLQDEGYDTVDANIELGFPADLRDYYVGAHILKDLGISRIKLMTNNPEKISGINTYGIEVVERVEIQMNHNEYNIFYLKTKQNKLGHVLSY
ncbi:MAG: bifunctional 3,4-dihydroxy-2-butanone-4-phosphate synthase/GTP cyclohydrolase II [Spirochaetaceae bacterium]|nr:bifunctional 3,4-dihydroxy-2-butanone-4-phosphate synthase/GTP cyclohydrolase II [Spirochaetaceae bacterium]